MDVIIEFEALFLFPMGLPNVVYSVACPCDNWDEITKDVWRRTPTRPNQRLQNNALGTRCCAS